MRSNMMTITRNKLLALFGLLIALHAPQPALAAEPFQWDSRVQRGQLTNGFSYYIVSGKEMGNQVALQLMVRAGSLDETDDQSGVAHMVEHMVFHSTKSHPEGLKNYMEGLGWRIGRHYNAQTNFERTLYQLTTDKKPQRIDAGLDVLADIAGGALIPADGLERERQIILEEWRTKLGVRERMDKQRRAMLREGSLYPERPTIGTDASIRQQPAQALRKFYADWYRPANMALIVVGNVDVETLKARIERSFGGLIPAALPARNAADPRLREQLRIVRLQDPESGASQVGWVTRFAADKRQDSAGLRERIIDRIAERSLRALVRQAGEQLPSGVSSLSSSRGELGESTASLGFAASVAVDGHRAGLREIVSVQERVRREGLRADDIRKEIEEVRRLNQKGPAQQAARDFGGWLQMLGEAVESNRPLQDPLQKQAQIAKILGGLDPADINARARQWIDAPDRVLFLIAPGLSPLTLPSAVDVGLLQQELAQRPLAPLAVVKKEVAPARVADVASSGAIVRDDDLGQGARRWTLQNGDALIWRHAPKDTLMRFSAQAAAGYRLPGAPSWQWQLAAQLGRDADLDGQAEGELARWMAERKLQLSQQQSDTQLNYAAQVQPAQADDLLRLYAARQTRSQLSPSALASAIQQLARQSARQPKSASDRMAKEMSRLRFGDLPQDAMPDQAALRELDTPEGLQTLRQQWDRLSRQPVTYFLSGPLEAAAARALAERYLAGIPRRADDAAPSALLQQPGYRERRLDIGIEPQGSVRAMGSQPMRWTPGGAMRTAILSRILYRQLRHELREKEAGIYRLNFNVTLDPRQHRLLSELLFTAAPERLDALWEAARRVLANLPEQLEPAMLDEEIQKMRGEEAKRAGDPVTAFNRLQLSYAQYGDARYLNESQHLAAALSSQSVRALAGEFKLDRDLAVVKVLPEPGKYQR